MTYFSLLVYWIAAPSLFVVLKKEPNEGQRAQRKESWIHFCLVSQEAILLTLATLLGMGR